MVLRGLRLSIAILATAAALAAGLIAYLLHQQNEALQAADWVARSLDNRARLQQLKAAIEDGPQHYSEARVMAEALSQRLAHRSDTSAALDSVVHSLATKSTTVVINQLIDQETRLLRERRQNLDEESRLARLALLVGGLVITVLLATAFAIVIRDNRRRLTAEAELRATNEDLEARVAARTAEQHLAESRLRELSRRLLSVQEEERRALARELHDEVGQQLGALKLNLKALARNCDGAQAERVADGLGIVELTITHIRDRALDLRPALLDDLGLAAALDWLCRQQAERSGIGIQLAVSPLPTFSTELATAVYRVVQEAITNALKHASAHRIDVALTLENDRLDLLVADDGCGFDSNDIAVGVGLPGMRERVETLGGGFDQDSQPGAGTRILATFPLPDHEPSNPPAAG